VATSAGISRTGSSNGLPAGSEKGSISTVGWSGFSNIEDGASDELAEVAESGRSRREGTGFLRTLVIIGPCDSAVWVIGWVALLKAGVGTVAEAREENPLFDSLKLDWNGGGDAEAGWKG